MDSKQQNSLIGSLIILSWGLIDLIYYSFIFYFTPFIIISTIITIIGLIFVFLAIFNKLTFFTHYIGLRRGETSLIGLVLCWALGMLCLLAFILEPSWRPYFFFLLVIGLTTAGFGTYLYITVE